MDRSHCRAFSRTTAAVVSLLAWTAAVSSSAQDAAAVDEDRALGPEPAAELAPGNEAVSEAFRYEAHWQAKVDADLIDEAIDIATSWVNAATVQYGDDSAEAFVPTLRLAETHYINDDPAKSVAAYLDAIKVGERNFGAVSPLLVKPLQRLGQIYQQQDDDEAAISALMRAKDITHRNAGIFNIEQGPIVDLLTESFWSMGDIRQATREQRFLFGTAEKTYGDDNPNLVPALHKWARHNARIGRLSDSRQIYHRALEVMENTYGPNDLRLIDTLYRMANTLVPAGAGGQDNQYYPREGAIALSRAIDIYQAQEFVDNEDVLTAQARLGDWYMRNDRRNRALDTYQSAIDQARASGIDEASIDRQFGA
ncbi:MAG: tetratricopeptide repeat protein, partial [Pseudomonadota bacterium]